MRIYIRHLFKPSFLFNFVILIFVGRDVQSFIKVVIQRHGIECGCSHQSPPPPPSGPAGGCGITQNAALKDTANRAAMKLGYARGTKEEQRYFCL